MRNASFNSLSSVDFRPLHTDFLGMLDAVPQLVKDFVFGLPACRRGVLPRHIGMATIARSDIVLGRIASGSDLAVAGVRNLGPHSW